MRNLRTFKKHPTAWTIVLLVVLVILTHRSVFLQTTILSSGDWNYLFRETAEEYLQMIPAWRIYPNGLGGANLNALFFPTNYLLGYFLLHLGFPIMERLVYFIPSLLLSVIGMFLLAKHLVRGHVGAFVGALMYAFNSYFVVTSASHPTIAVSYALAPLFILFFIKFYNEDGYVSGVWTYLFAFLMMGYEFRIFYLVAVVMALYLVSLFVSALFQKKKELVFSYLKKSLFLLIGVLGMSAYWLLGMVQMGSGLNNPIFNRGLWGSQYYDILHAFAFHYSFWNPEGFTPFEHIAVPVVYFLFPLLFFLAFFFKKKSKEIAFFCFLGFLGILLTKQEGPPFEQVYTFLFTHVPGFSVFREASKFYLFTALSYSIAGAFVVHQLIKMKIQHRVKHVLRQLAIVGIILVSSLNMIPLIQNKTERNFTPKSLPQDYQVFKDVLSDQQEFFRVLWVPRYERWSFWNTTHPRLGLVDLMEAQWMPFFAEEKANNTLSVEDRLTSLFQKDFANHLLDRSQVKYVVVPLQSADPNDDVFLPYGGKSHTDIRQWYAEKLDTLPWLKRINSGFGDLIVYENSDYKPLFFPVTSFQAVQSTHLEASPDVVSDTLFLNADILAHKDDLSAFIDTWIIPVEPDQKRVREFEEQIKHEEDPKIKGERKQARDLYLQGYFLQDATVSIPSSGDYRIYLKNDSILGNSKSVSMTLGETRLEQRSGKSSEQQGGYRLFQIGHILAGEYSLHVENAGERVEAIQPQDIVFASESGKVQTQNKLPELSIERKSPMEYDVHINNAQASFPLVFSDTFHSGWKLSIGSTNTPVFDEKHVIVNSFQNGWVIDLPFLEKQGLVSKDEKGNYNFVLTCTFVPQNMFVLGWWMTVGTILLSALFLIYKFARKFYTKNDCIKPSEKK